MGYKESAALHLAAEAGRYLFDVIWRSLLKALQQAGEAGKRAAESLLRHHLLTVEDGNGERLLEAGWRAGLDRILPGTGAGRGCQESWHKWVLEDHIPQVYQTPSRFPGRLTKNGGKPYVIRAGGSVKLAALAGSFECSYHWAEAYLFALKGKLRPEKRSSAVELWQSGAWQGWEDDAGNFWMAVPRSLWQEQSVRDSRGRRVIKQVPYTPAPLPADMLPKIPDLLAPHAGTCGSS